MYKERRLREYIEDLAAKKPAPGGGSAAAFAASLGASLICMVANFTLGKKKFKKVEGQIEEILAKAQNFKRKALELVDLDVAIFKKLSEARGKAEAEFQVVLKEAVGCPLEVCKLSCDAIKLCASLANIGNPLLASDVGVAAEFLEAGFNSALLNVQINLKEIEDEDFVLRIRETLKPQEREVALIRKEVERKVGEAIRG